MKTQKNITAFALLGIALLVGVLLISSISTHGRPITPTSNAIAGDAAGANNAGDTISAPPANVIATTTAMGNTRQFAMGSPNLVGASMQEFTQFAQNWTQQQLKAQGTPEVLLTRSVTREDVAALGLGCLPDFAAIEQPPLMLAILKGHLDFRGSVPGSANVQGPEPGSISYVAYVFDVWSASPVAMRASNNGSSFKRALNDATLPDPTNSISSVCPTQVPVSQKHLHYGQEAPGGTVPPHPTADVQATETALAQAPPTAPEPVPTAQDQIPTIIPGP